MKMNYFIRFNGFGNQYELCWSPSLKPLQDGFEQITRKDAIAYAVEERKRRKYEPDFAYYADAYIYPEDWDCERDAVDWNAHIEDSYFIRRGR